MNYDLNYDVLSYCISKPLYDLTNYLPVHTCVIGRKRICIAMPPVLCVTYGIVKAHPCILSFGHFPLPMYRRANTKRERTPTCLQNSIGDTEYK